MGVQIVHAVAAVWHWFSQSTPEKLIVALGALMAAFRMQSHREHKKTTKALNGNLLSRIERIEDVVDDLRVQLAKLLRRKDSEPTNGDDTHKRRRISDRGEGTGTRR